MQLKIIITHHLRNYYDKNLKNEKKKEFHSFLLVYVSFIEVNSRYLFTTKSSPLLPTSIPIFFRERNSKKLPVLFVTP